MPSPSRMTVSRPTCTSTCTPILHLDLPLLKKRHINLISPVLIVNYEKVRDLTPTGSIGAEVAAGKDAVLRYAVRAVGDHHAAIWKRASEACQLRRLFSYLEFPKIPKGDSDTGQAAIACAARRWDFPRPLSYCLSDVSIIRQTIDSVNGSSAYSTGTYFLYFSNRTSKNKNSVANLSML